MAPVSGPLTHGVPCTQPSAIATLMSLNRAVAARTLSISGEVSGLSSEAFCGVWPANVGCPPVARKDIASGSKANVKRRKIFIDGLLRQGVGFGSGRLFVEVRIEDANLGDLRDGQLVADRGTADGLGCGPVADAKGTLAIGGHVRMNPRDTILGVVVDDCTAKFRAVFALRDAEAVREIAFDQVAGHWPRSPYGW